MPVLLSAVTGAASRAGHVLRERESSFHDFGRSAVGLRVIEQVGWLRLARLVVAIMWLSFVAQVAIFIRSDLIHPADLGSDSSNYLASVERVAAGHDLYRLRPGDRPVAVDNAPDWTVPILSPPTIATAYAWSVVLPSGLRLEVPWAIGFGATVSLGLVASALAPFWILLVILWFMPGLAVTAWSGNVNALLGPALAIVPLCVLSRSSRAQVVAGVVVAIAAAVKIGPAFVALWLILQGRRISIAALLVTGIAFLLVTVLWTGLQPFLEFVGIVRGATAAPTPLSLPGLAQSVGVGTPLSALALPGGLALLTLGIVIFRRRPESFLLAIIATIFATSIVRFESIALIAVAGVGWSAHTGGPGGANGTTRIDGARSATFATVAGAAAASIALAISVVTGGLVTSSMSVVNETSLPVIARFAVNAQVASFGYLVPPGGAIVGWRGVDGASPPVVAIWSESCEFLGEAQLPRTGGVVTVAASGVRVAPSDVSGPATSEYVRTCAPALKALLSDVEPPPD